MGRLLASGHPHQTKALEANEVRIEGPNQSAVLAGNRTDQQIAEPEDMPSTRREQRPAIELDPRRIGGSEGRNCAQHSSQPSLLRRSGATEQLHSGRGSERDPIFLEESPQFSHQGDRATSEEADPNGSVDEGQHAQRFGRRRDRLRSTSISSFPARSASSFSFLRRTSSRSATTTTSVLDLKSRSRMASSIKSDGMSSVVRTSERSSRMLTDVKPTHLDAYGYRFSVHTTRRDLSCVSGRWARIAAKHLP